MPIYHDVQQGSAEWMRLHFGVPSAGSFDKIITPKTGKLSASARHYAYELLAEKLLNAPVQSLDGLEYIERGRELEPLAVKQYEFQTEVATDRVGFITTNDGRIGASPDRVWRDRTRAVEVKCPAAHTHLGYLLDGQEADTYRPQVQGQIYVGEFDGADFYSFHPRMPPVLIKAVRDEPYIKAMETVLREFLDKLDALEERARSFGVFQAFDGVVSPVDLAREPGLAEGWPE
jgi:hypothetical protein